MKTKTTTSTKIKKQDYYCFGDNFINILESLKEQKKTFDVQITGYTTVVKTERQNIFICEKPNSKKILIAYSKINSDIIKSKYIFPIVDRNKINYYLLKNDFRNLKITDELFFDEIVNIDISGAYAQAMYNFNIISDATFEYLKTVDKVTRLKAVGMIAASKNVFHYEDGKYISDEIIRDEKKRNIFFLLCKKIGDLMTAVADELEDSFLFFWVDGIYFTDKNKIQNVINIFGENNYSCRVELLNNFSARKKQEDENSEIIKIKFNKEDKEKNFSIPLHKKNFLNNLNNYLKTEKQNDTCN